MFHCHFFKTMLFKDIPGLDEVKQSLLQAVQKGQIAHAQLFFGNEGSGSLEPYGKVWRTGANEATEITFKKDAMFGGKPVKAGTYSLYSIPGEKEWTVILNPELKQWGAFGYDKVKDKDVAQVTVPTKMYDTSAEKLMFDVEDDSKLKFQWDKMGFEVPITYQK